MTDNKALASAKITLIASVTALVMSCADQRNQPDCTDVLKAGWKNLTLKFSKMEWRYTSQRVSP